MPVWFKAFCDIVEAIAYTFMLVPATLAVYKRRSLRGGMRILAYLPAYLFGMFVLTRIGNYIFHYNLPFIHISTIGETLLYIKIYHDEFIDKKAKQHIRILAAIFLLFAFIDSLWLEGFDKINSYTNLVESVFIIGLSFLFFERIAIQKRQIPIQKIPLFVATVGIVIYLSGTIILYLTVNHFIVFNDEYNARKIYLFNSLLVLLLAITLFRSFLLINIEHKKATII
ncbi:hypothetical protein [Hymenobacter rubripertinctus]|uniref:hypothetical protein n=1 Tax=Hymenobacter rubripertinctus TaxID=2029981 RepID=UPI0011C39346|nr:hypothetical protein [Hymenobacter rubripertinctus]